MVKAKTKERLILEKAVEILAKGGIVVFPTDTVYGFGCKFDDKVAVSRLYQIKGTPKNQPMPVLIDKKSYLKKFGCKVPPAAKKLINTFWPGAVTLIFNSKFGKIGLRMPNHPITLSLISEAGFPIIGTSANFHRKPTPKSFSELDGNFLEKVDFVLEGECFLQKESTIVDFTTSPPKVLRQGALRPALQDSGRSSG